MRYYWPWIVAVVWLLGYETYAVIYARKTKDWSKTLTWRMRGLTARYPIMEWIILFAAGVLAGHFWW